MTATMINGEVEASVAVQRALPLEVTYRPDVVVTVADVLSAEFPDHEARFRKFRCADGIRDTSTLDACMPTDVARFLPGLREGVYKYASIGWMPYLPHWVAAAAERGLGPREYLDEIYQQCDEVNRQIGFRGAWIDLIGEVGNSIQWPVDHGFSKQEAHAYVLAYLTDGRVLSEHWDRMLDPSVISFHTDAMQRVESLRELPVNYVDACLYALQAAFRMGFPLVVYEAQAHSRVATQVGLAFARGGGKQWDALWGVDYSPWGPVEGETHLTTEGLRYQGQTPDHLERSWLAGYLSGANFVQYERAARHFYGYLPDGDVMLSDYGHAAARLHALTNGPLAERGEAIAPLALMLEVANGYGVQCCRWFDEAGNTNVSPTQPSLHATPDVPIWSNVLEPTAADLMVQRMVQLLWPNASKPWDDGWPDGPTADYAEQETGELMRLGLEDPRRYNRFMHQSTWADAFDVVTEEADAASLSRFYNVVCLVGDVRLTKALREQLSPYVREGGQVVVCVDQADPDVLDAWGIVVPGTGSRRVGYTARRADGTTFSSTQWVWQYDLETMPAQASARCIEQTSGMPFVFELPEGDGRWTFVNIPHGMDIGSHQMALPYRELIDDLYAEHVGVKYVGPPVHMMLNRRSRDVLVTLMNHTATRWEGRVSVDEGVYGPVHGAIEVTTGQAYPQRLVERKQRMVTVPASVEPFGYRLLAFQLAEFDPAKVLRMQQHPAGHESRKRAIQRLRSSRAEDLLPHVGGLR